MPLIDRIADTLTFRQASWDWSAHWVIFSLRHLFHFWYAPILFTGLIPAISRLCLFRAGSFSQYRHWPLRGHLLSPPFHRCHRDEGNLPGEFDRFPKFFICRLVLVV